MSLTQRISPRLVDLQQRKLGYELQETDEPKSSDAPNNLYGPLPGGERGTFTDREQRWSLYPAISEKRKSIVLGLAAAGLACGAWALSQSRGDRSGGTAGLLERVRSWR